MSRTEPWATVDDVKHELGCERTKATEIIKRHLGGFKPAGLDAWRCTWRAIREYKKACEGTPTSDRKVRVSACVTTPVSFPVRNGEIDECA